MSAPVNISQVAKEIDENDVDGSISLYSSLFIEEGRNYSYNPASLEEKEHILHLRNEDATITFIAETFVKCSPDFEFSATGKKARLFSNFCV